MKRLTWNIAAMAGGALAAAMVRRLTAAVWPGPDNPPLNPADRNVSWTQALGWAALTGVGAGVARLLSKRVTAAGWESAFGEAPPTVTPS